jgi:uncharacterized protein (DUF1778 family)
MTARKRSRGRPPLPKGEDRDVVLTLRLKAAERKALERAAKTAGTSVSAWARDVLMAQTDVR